MSSFKGYGIGSLIALLVVAMYCGAHYWLDTGDANAQVRSERSGGQSVRNVGGDDGMGYEKFSREG